MKIPRLLLSEIPDPRSLAQRMNVKFRHNLQLFQGHFT